MLTIDMLESSPLEDQIQITYEYLLPIIEEIHLVQAKEITMLLVGRENNFEIMNMIGDSDLLHAKVNEMDALLNEKEAGSNEQLLKRTFPSKKRNKKRMNTNRNINILYWDLFLDYLVMDLVMDYSFV